MTGGTSGLGLLTGRWLTQHGARRLILASRNGALAHDTASEWEAMRATGAAAALERCDAAEATHVRRLVTLTSCLEGVWHAAGVIADALLPRQGTLALARVCAPKAHGAWLLHDVCAATGVRAFALFSSVAALLGGAGQSNYACLLYTSPSPRD